MAQLQHEGTAEIRISSSAGIDFFNLKGSDKYQLLPSQNLQHISGLKGSGKVLIELNIKPMLKQKPSTLQIEKIIFLNNVEIVVRTFLNFNTKYNHWRGELPLSLPSSTAVPTPTMYAKTCHIALTDAIFEANVKYHLDMITKVRLDLI